jgi:hypothetical protein
MTVVIDSIQGHYEVHRTSYAENYVWCHGYVVVECDCGERALLSAHETACECGTDHAALVNGVLASQRESHPWDAEYREWRKGQDENLLSEETYWLELSRLD